MSSSDSLIKRNILKNFPAILLTTIITGFLVLSIGNHTNLLISQKSFKYQLLVLILEFLFFFTPVYWITKRAVIDFIRTNTRRKFIAFISSSIGIGILFFLIIFTFSPYPQILRVSFFTLDKKPHLIEITPSGHSNPLSAGSEVGLKEIKGDKKL